MTLQAIANSGYLGALDAVDMPGTEIDQLLADALTDKENSLPGLKRSGRWRRSIPSLPPTSGAATALSLDHMQKRRRHSAVLLQPFDGITDETQSMNWPAVAFAQ